MEIVFLFLVVVWSGVNVAGVRLVDLNKDIGLDTDPEKWIDLHHQVINRCVEVTANEFPVSSEGKPVSVDINL